ncbi:sensor histidine kinase [Pedobacter sp. KLB.chiD]|uniref:sensor histidine kinase n=1 Tax=Pedobacter sp. KLB.chiD TaxID=3387402 RepID=UPI00399AC58F
MEFNNQRCIVPIEKSSITMRGFVIAWLTKLSRMRIMNKNVILLSFFAKIGRFILVKWPFKHTLKELQKARQLNRFRSRFVNMSVHDLGTPLSNIELSIEICKMLLENRPDQKKIDRFKEKLDDILAETHRISTIVNALSEVNNSEDCILPYTPDAVWFNRFIYSYLETYGKTVVGERELKISLFANDARVSIDAALMTNVMENIISNAVKYSPDNTPIYIRTKDLHDRVVLEIEDLGIGISAEDTPFLFQEFFRAKNVGKISGSGLGLSIAKAFVEMNHGTIQIESRANKGTTVKITLAKLMD